MKSTTYFAEITTEKAEKYMSERGKLESIYLLARFVSTKKFSV